MTPIGPFKGLNKHPGAADQAGFLSAALNVVMRPDGSAERRAALRYRAALPADTIGIYGIGDQLRTVGCYVTGDETADAALAPTIYVDYITNPTPRTLKALIGQVTDSAGRSLVLLRYDDDSTKIHHCPLVGTPPSAPTGLSIGFTPDFALIRAAGRAHTMDANLRYWRYSAVDSDDVVKLEDWIPGDLADSAGFEAVSQHAAGAGKPQALGIFGGALVVFYRSALVIYHIDVDQAAFFLQQVIAGAGTSAPASIAEISTDLIFLSDAGVRTLSTISQTGNAGETPIQGNIDPLAVQLAAPVNMRPVAHYAKQKNLYLLAFGQDVLCLAVMPGANVLGWSQWRLPVAVDAWAESNGQVWVRSGNSLYSLDDALDSDQTDETHLADIPALVESLPMRLPLGGMANRVAASGSEPLQVQVVVDGRPGLDIGGAPLGSPIILPPRSPVPASAGCSKSGKSFAVRAYDAAAKAGWRVDNLWLQAGPVGES